MQNLEHKGTPTKYIYYCQAYSKLWDLLLVKTIFINAPVIENVQKAKHIKNVFS